MIERQQDSHVQDLKTELARKDEAIKAALPWLQAYLKTPSAASRHAMPAFKAEKDLSLSLSPAPSWLDEQKAKMLDRAVWLLGNKVVDCYCTGVCRECRVLMKLQEELRAEAAALRTKPAQWGGG